MSLGYVTIPASSALVFADAPINLTAHGIIVNGNLSIGTEACRMTSDITITLRGRRPSSNSASLPPPTKAIYVNGTGQLDIHGALYHDTWVRVAVSASAGDSWIFLQRGGLNWLPGQSVVITTTALKDARDYNENEVRTITDVAVVPGADVNLTAIRVLPPLAYAHYGGREYQAEVALLSRSVVVQGAADDSEPAEAPVSCTNTTYSSYPCSSANLTGFGGSIVVEGSRTRARISGVALVRMGQTNFEGRFPIHFNRLGESGRLSYVQDAVVWGSYYRCVGLTATNTSRIARTVGFDISGHCFYLAEGAEERNVLDHNLAAFVNAVGGLASLEGAFGYSLPSVQQDENRTDPTDVAAAGFYVPNAFNVLRGNAASGGWTGYHFPILPRAVAGSRNVGAPAPASRPTLSFDGNSAHSTGYWWNWAGCVYIGGLLEYQADNTSLLRFDPGRFVEGRPSLMQLNNTKVALCNTGITTWGAVTNVVSLEVHDIITRAFLMIGDVYVTKMLATCRTANRPGMPGNRWAETQFATGNITLIQWFDVDQYNIITNTTFRTCDLGPGRRARAFEFAGHSSRYTPDFMQVTRETRFEDFPDATRTMILGRQGPYPIALSGMLQNWLDSDGSASGRGVPTIIGSALANNWWRLDDACTPPPDPWSVWGCDKTASRAIASMVMQWDPIQQYLFTPQLLNCSTNLAQPCFGVGYVAHVGYTSRHDSLPLTLPGRVTGVTGGFGWYIRMDAGAPRRLQITRVQLPRNQTLLLALPYPPGTRFNISQRATTTCNPITTLCRWNFRAVDSVASVRSGPGDTYFFDNTTLWVRATPQRSQSVGVSGEWGVPYAAGFMREGYELPARMNGALVIEAECAEVDLSGNYCVLNATEPASPCGPGLQQVGMDTCVAVTPSPSPSVSVIASPEQSSTASASASATGSASMSSGTSATVSWTLSATTSTYATASDTPSLSISEAMSASTSMAASLSTTSFVGATGSMLASASSMGTVSVSGAMSTINGGSHSGLSSPFPSTTSTWSSGTSEPLAPTSPLAASASMHSPGATLAPTSPLTRSASTGAMQTANATAFLPLASIDLLSNRTNGTRVPSSENTSLLLLSASEDKVNALSSHGVIGVSAGAVGMLLVCCAGLCCFISLRYRNKLTRWHRRRQETRQLVAQLLQAPGAPGSAEQADDVPAATASSRRLLGGTDSMLGVEIAELISEALMTEAGEVYAAGYVEASNGPVGQRTAWVKARSSSGVTRFSGGLRNARQSAETVSIECQKQIATKLNVRLPSSVMDTLLQIALETQQEREAPPSVSNTTSCSEAPLLPAPVAMRLAVAAAVSAIPSLELDERQVQGEHDVLPPDAGQGNSSRGHMVPPATPQDPAPPPSPLNHLRAAAQLAIQNGAAAAFKLGVQVHAGAAGRRPTFSGFIIAYARRSVNRALGCCQVRPPLSSSAARFDPYDGGDVALRMVENVAGRRKVHAHRESPASHMSAVMRAAKPGPALSATGSARVTVRPANGAHRTKPALVILSPQTTPTTPRYADVYSAMLSTHTRVHRDRNHTGDGAAGATDSEMRFSVRPVQASSRRPGDRAMFPLQGRDNAKGLEESKAAALRQWQ